MSSFNRRDFIKTSVMTGAGLAISKDALAANSPAAITTAPPRRQIAEPMKKVRIGFVGIGSQGGNHLRILASLKGVEITAVCDVVPERVARAKKVVTDAGGVEPAGYSGGDNDFENLCARDDIDLVFNAAPWRFHVPVALCAMKNGKHSASEIPMCTSVEDGWKLIKAAESSGKYCMMMENCNYDRVEMQILNMIKKDLFGDLVHAECGYLHDLRAVKFDFGGEGDWRREHAKTRNGDLYPTHGLGPVMQCMDINRGNYFDYLVSFASQPAGLHDYAVKRFGADSQYAKEKYVLGAVVTTMIKTMAGATIMVQHDTSLPRPYSRDIMVQGTKGIARKYPEALIHLDGITEPHRWQDMKEHADYNHPLWKMLDKAKEDAAAGASHGGMDYLEDYRLIDALLKGVEPDQDVYDAVTISVITELSANSIATGSQPIKFPDFGRGAWKEKRDLPVMSRPL
jgi:predicted dehydrogenase